MKVGSDCMQGKTEKETLDYGKEGGDTIHEKNMWMVVRIFVRFTQSGTVIITSRD